MKKLHARCSALTTVIAAAMVLTACSGGSAQTQQDIDFGTPVAGEVKEGILNGRTLTFAGAGGNSQEAVVEATLTPFAKTSGAQLFEDTFDIAKLRAMVESKNVTWDIAHDTSLDTAKYCGELYEKIDRSKIDASLVPDGAVTDDCMVPSNYLGYTVAYNTDAFGNNPPKSFADFFDTAKFPGKRSVGMGSYIQPQILEFALIADGVDPAGFVPDDIDKAINKLKSLGDNLIPWTTGAQSQQQLESGEVVMSLVWHGRGAAAAGSGAPVAPMWDQWIVDVDSFAIPKGSANSDAAHAAMNYHLGAKQQTTYTSLVPYGAVNKDATPSEDPVKRKWLVTDHLDTATEWNLQFWLDNYDRMSSAWAAWVTGA